MKMRLMLCFVILTTMALSCAFYSFSGALPPHLNTVAIPLFENRTPEFGLGEELTDWIIEEFTRDNSLKIADRSSADIVIEGQITRVEDRAGAFDQRERAQDFKIYITVQIVCTDQVKREKMWEERLTQFGSYNPGLGPDDRAEGMEEAIGKISQDILTKTVSGW